MQEFRVRAAPHVKAILSAIENLGRAILRPWRQFQAWRCGRAWEEYFRTNPIVLLEQREADADLALSQADPGFAASLESSE